MQNSSYASLARRINVCGLQKISKDTQKYLFALSPVDS